MCHVFSAILIDDAIGAEIQHLTLKLVFGAVAASRGLWCANIHTHPQESVTDETQNVIDLLWVSVTLISTDEASCHLRRMDPNGESGAVLQQSAATEGVFRFLRPLLVWSQVDDLTAVQIAGVLVRMRATGSVKNAYFIAG